MKKGLMSLTVAGLSVLSMVACTGNNNSNTSASGTTFKAGLITLHDENSTYDKNFIDAFKAACTKMGVTAVIATGVDEGEAAYTKAAELVDAGCKFVFADSFGHESYILKAAKEFEAVQFSHATGTTAHTAGVSNFHNAFASIYEGRYLAGVAAGLKLKAMIEADATTSHNIGYVGAYPYAEVKSGYTSWYLGVKSVVEDVTMSVKFTNSWYDETAEKNAANDLITSGCSIISQHADSWGAPTACETAGVPNVTYNGSTESRCPDTYLISSKVNWEPYFEYAIGQVQKGESIDTDWTGTLASDFTSGSVALTEPGKKAAVDGTSTKLEEVATKLRNKTLRVFDCSTFTVGGQHLTSYKADVDTDAAYTPDTEVIKTEGGITYFAESEYRSAPYFDIDIDGITKLN
jgi:basic membrane protein A and related proteins